jgi:hypothetical protein
MIGYYIHHVGRGHLHRALSIARRLHAPVTALSSLPPHPDWPGQWLSLPRDDAGNEPADPTAGGMLHWAPRHDPGLQDRMSLIGNWIAAARPAAFVVDVSVEVIVLARLLGVPVITVALPGERADRAHQSGFGLAEAIIAPWPEALSAIGPDLRRHGAKVCYVGAISRFDSRSVVREQHRVVGEPARVLILSGVGGGTQDRRTPEVSGWNWNVLGAAGWVEDPWQAICDADIVVTHAGLGALADVATAGRPAVIVPQQRPHHEQDRTARGLLACNIAVVSFEQPTDAQWPSLLTEARQRGGQHWQRWLAGPGARGAAEVIETVSGARRSSSCG